MSIFSRLFIIITMLFITTTSTKALNFEEAFNQTSRTPMVMLIYANWADGYENCIVQFRTTQRALGNKFNFVELDIANKDAKAFNRRFHIYPNLPYILMFRDGGKVSRYIPQDCANSSACVIPKLKSFIQ